MKVLYKCKISHKSFVFFFSVQIYSSYLQMCISDLCLTKYRVEKVFQSKWINISLFACHENINNCNTGKE